MPVTTLSSIDISIVIDEENGFESSNSLTLAYIDPPTIASISPLFVAFIPTKTKIATITGTGFMNAPDNKLYVYISGGQLITLDATSDTEIEIPLPIMNIGKQYTHIFMSIDKNYFVSHELVTPGEITS